MVFENRCITPTPAKIIAIQRIAMIPAPVAWRGGARLAEIIAIRSDFTEDDVHAAMSGAGIQAPVADRAYKFTQTAWGRAFSTASGYCSLISLTNRRPRHHGSL
jgi:hypothetical protein